MSEAEVATRVAPPPGMPVSDLDPYSVENIINPYPMHDALRELGPMVWLSRYDLACVARHEPMGALLMNTTDFLNAGGVGMSDIRKPGAWRAKGPLAEADPPDHTQVRMAMNRIFNPGAIKKWRETYQGEAERLVAKALEAESFDIVADLVEPYVFFALSSALGVELDRDNIIVVGNHSFNSSGPRNDIFYESLARAEAISDWLEEKRQRSAMKPGGFGEAVFNAEEAGEIPAGTAHAMLLTLIRGGMDTTVSGLGSSVRLLAEHPDVWAAMKSDPGLAVQVFEEALRLESPVQGNYRTTASHEVEFEGFRIPPETKVLSLHAAANRDPRVWDEPDAFKPGQRPPSNKHYAFGLGAHICLGRVLARLEAESFLNVLRARAERLEILAPPVYRAVNALRTIDRMPMRIA